MRHLRRKITLNAHGDQVVLVKRKQERIEHVWMKAFLWALYRPQYPELSVKVDVNDNYKPDVVSVVPKRGEPRFWGEAGHVGREKVEALLTRYSATHFAIAKWDQSLAPTREMIEPAIVNSKRAAPIDLVSFPANSAERFVDTNGDITVPWDGLEWERLG